MFVVCADDECNTFCGDRSASSWKNTLVMTMSPVLSVWHAAFADCLTVTVAGVAVVMATAEAALTRPSDGRTGESLPRIERAS